MSKMIEALSSEELQFIQAIEAFKEKEHKHFLSWTEVLKVLKELGYRRRRSGQPGKEVND